MTSDRLRKLLDGELDLEEAANDPILSSLASRIYNIDMSEVNPSGENDKQEELDKSNLSFELHGSDSPEALEIELPDLPPLGIPESAKSIKEVPKSLKISSMIMIVIGPIISFCALLNIFGVFGFLKSCDSIIANNGFCVEGRDRLSWLAIGRLNHTEGWIESGTFGLPTMILIIFGVILMFIGIQLRMYSKN